jgi:hypothetical protein
MRTDVSASERSSPGVERELEPVDLATGEPTAATAGSGRSGEQGAGREVWSRCGDRGGRGAPGDRCGRPSEFADGLRPTALRFGCEDELALVLPILEHGTSYQRQRQVAASAGGQLRTVVHGQLDEMRVGLPL